MRLVNVSVTGFRCFAQKTTIEFNQFTAILGRNDVGKSTFLEALQIFFDDSAPESADVNSNAEEVSISCEFSEIPESLIIDANFPTTLKHEFLLNQHQRLEVRKIYDGSLKTPKLKGIFVRALHPRNQGYNDLLSLKNSELKSRALELQINLDDIPKNINTALRQAIWSNCTDLDLQLTDIAVDEESAKKIWEQLKAYLPLYALFKADRPSTDQDAEAQDPIKIAVIEALKSQEAKLEELRSAVESAVLNMAKLTVEKLAEIDPSLASELRPTVHKPNWANAFKIGFTDDSEVSINKRGSGVRRMILLNFFRARAEQRNVNANSPGVIYAIEEPETSQHPHNQKLLLKAFFELAEEPGQQVIITTHNPALARDLPTSSLRLISRYEDKTRQIHSNEDEVFTRAARELGVLADNQVKAFIGVEGMNDINFFKGISQTLSKSDASIPDLELAEKKGHVIFIPLAGSNLSSWINRLENLNRPEFHFFDRDSAPPNLPKYSKEAESISTRKDCIVVHTDCREAENYIPAQCIQEHWPDIGYDGHTPFCDVPLKVAQLITSKRGSNWDEIGDKGRKEAEAGVKRKLNNEVIKLVTAEQLLESDPQQVIKKFLSDIGQVLSR